MARGGTQSVRILGGGPAGCCAALAALDCGGRVEVADRSLRHRHKVCGEFFSPGIESVLDRLGVWDSFQALAPTQIRRMTLTFGRRRIDSPLPDTGWGLSRFAYDGMLRKACMERGCVIYDSLSGSPHIAAVGRSHANAPQRGERLFGWKAHYSGPGNDAVELYFFGRCYVGVSPVENGRTNVCGIGPESVMRRYGFDVDELLESHAVIRDRLAPLARCWDWVHVGPLVFQNRFDDAPDVFPAGDALSFVDPFTGSGLLCAALTGELAGRYAVLGRSRAEYLTRCRQMLRRPFRISSGLRSCANTWLGGHLAGFVPAELLFRWTRPLAIG